MSSQISVIRAIATAVCAFFIKAFTQALYYGMVLQKAAQLHLEPCDWSSEAAIGPKKKSQLRA